MDHETESQPPTVVGTRAVERVVAVLLVVFGVVVMVEARKLGATWTSDGPGAGYFPFYIALIITISGLGTLVGTFRARRKDDEPFVDREQLKRIGSVLVPAALYVAVIHLVGLYIASAIYIAGFMIVLGRYPWLRAVVIGVAVNAVFFLMFEVWFKVPLFKGSLDPLSFLGY